MMEEAGYEELMAPGGQPPEGGGGGPSAEGPPSGQQAWWRENREKNTALEALSVECTKIGSQVSGSLRVTDTQEP